MTPARRDRPPATILSSTTRSCASWSSSSCWRGRSSAACCAESAPTSRRGRGLEFSDFRQYRPGDDFRHIDWNIYSRLDQLFLKLHASEEDLTLHLIVDASASMGFGEPSKFDHARRLAAALAYIALHNLDRVGVSVFADGSGREPAPHQGAASHGPPARFPRASCPAPGRRASAPRCATSRRVTRSPGLVILISDLLGAEDAGRRTASRRCATAVTTSW